MNSTNSTPSQCHADRKIGWRRRLTFALLLPTALYPADLAWSKNEVALNLNAKEKVVKTEFPFRNTGSKMVRIVSVAPSCDCLIAEADKVAYSPGESGVIRAEYDVAGREGRLEQSIKVITDEISDHTKRLRLVVNLPEPIEIRPRLLVWKLGEPLVGKSMDLRLAETAKIQLGEVQCTESTFNAKVESLPEPGQHRIQVIPSNTSQLAQATIRLNATVDGLPRVYVVYVAVK